MAIPKFKPLVDSFKVGNWIRTQVNDNVYKLRLLEYDIGFGNFDNIQVEFSDVSKIKNGITDVESILSQASSMATSYSSIQRQANLGNKANSTIYQWLEDGLNTALVQIQSNDNEDISITKNGLLCRTYDDVTETYSPEQLKITHNIMAYTDDDWETVKQAIGKHDYKYYDESKGAFVDGTGYGVSADFLTAAYVSGSQIIGGDIYSDNYSKVNEAGSYINLRDGTFSFGGGALRFDGDKLIISSNAANSNLTEINEDWLKTTDVFAQNLQVGAANIDGVLTADKIDATELCVDGANIYGTVTANRAEANEFSIYPAEDGNYASLLMYGVFDGNEQKILDISYVDTGGAPYVWFDGNSMAGWNLTTDFFKNVTFLKDVTFKGKVSGVTAVFA